MLVPSGDHAASKPAIGTPRVCPAGATTTIGPPVEVWNAIFVPSGDQSGRLILGPRSAINVSTPFLVIQRFPSRVKAIAVPSGDHAGSMSFPGSVVIRVTPVPSAFMT